MSIVLLLMVSITVYQNKNFTKSLFCLNKLQKVYFWCETFIVALCIHKTHTVSFYNVEFMIGYITRQKYKLVVIIHYLYYQVANSDNSYCWKVFQNFVIKRNVMKAYCDPTV